MPRRMLKKAVQQGRSERRGGRTLRYVEPLSDARTPLADFFSILLDSPYQRTNPVAHVTPPPKLPSKTMSWGRILPERTAWSSAIGNDADDVLP